MSVERCQGIPDVERAKPAICESIRAHAARFGVPVPDMPSGTSEASLLSATVSQWAALTAPKPLVVLFDEVDTLEGPALVSFLGIRSRLLERTGGDPPRAAALLLRSGAHVPTYAPLRCSRRLARKAACRRGFLEP